MMLCTLSYSIVSLECLSYMFQDVLHECGNLFNSSNFFFPIVRATLLTYMLILMVFLQAPVQCCTTKYSSLYPIMSQISILWVMYICVRFFCLLEVYEKSAFHDCILFTSNNQQIVFLSSHLSFFLSLNA